MRWCPKCGQPKEHHKVTRHVTVDANGMLVRQNVRHCPVKQVRTPEGQPPRFAVDAKLLRKYRAIHLMEKEHG